MKWRTKLVAKKRYQAAARSRRLTKAEVTNYRRIRETVENELPPAKPAPVKVAISKLRAMRQAKGVSLSELAARTGMTRGNLARLESRKARPSTRFNAMPRASTANWKSTLFRPKSKREHNANRSDDGEVEGCSNDELKGRT